MPESKVSQCKGYPQLFVPSKIIKSLGLAVGDRVAFNLDAEGNCIVKKKVQTFGFIKKKRLRSSRVLHRRIVQQERRALRPIIAAPRTRSIRETLEEVELILRAPNQ